MKRTEPAQVEADSHLQSDPHARRFEFQQDNELAGFIDYYQFDRVALVVHTEVRMQGQGYGSRLAAQALDFFREQGSFVAPVCGFLAGYIRKHPHYADLVTPDAKRIFNL